MNTQNQQTLYDVGNKTSNSGDDNATGRFKAVCDALKDQNITIYTIGFQIKANSNAEHALQYCASNPANYFLVESLDIGTAFNSIAGAINKLRISG